MNCAQESNIKDDEQSKRLQSIEYSTFLFPGMINRQTEDHTTSLEDAQRDALFVNETEQDEDREAACAIQETVKTRADNHLMFGYFQKAIVNFHQQLSEYLAK